MKFRLFPALALATALGSTVFLAVQADAQQGAGARAERQAPPPPREPMKRLSPEDRAAFLDARIAALHAGLKLTADQEKMWPAVEQAVREGLGKLSSLREQARAQPRPSDMIEGLRRMADADTARGDALHKLVDAAQPLYATLNEDQKRRLPLLTHGLDRPMRPMMGERMGPRDDDRGPPRRQGMMGPRDDDRDGRGMPGQGRL